MTWKYEFFPTTIFFSLYVCDKVHIENIVFSVKSVSMKGARAIRNMAGCICFVSSMERENELADGPSN